MLHGANVRWYRLAPERDGHRIVCDGEGMSVGTVPLLGCATNPRGSSEWSPRSLAEIEEDLSEAYDCPIDFSAKYEGLATVAGALNAGDIARAQSAALNLQLPDIPPLTKGARSDEQTAELVVALYFSDLLPAEIRQKVATFDPRLHPRWPSGAEDRQGGQFRPKDDDLLIPVNEEKERDQPKPAAELPTDRPPTKQELNRFARRQSEMSHHQVMTGAKMKAQAIGEFLARTGLPDAMADIFARFLSRFDDPKTLDELIALTKTDEMRQHAGYERHHIVEQGPNSGLFTRDQLESAENVVAIPYYRHRDISDWYSTPSNDYGGLTPRDFIRGKSFDEQYRFGLDAMRKFGVLK